MATQPDSATRAAPEVFYDWSAQGQPVSVSINLNLIDQLSLEVIEGFKSLPKRGLEIGGLLLGRVEEAAEHEPLLIIEDRELFNSEHLHGPSFLLSPHDREQWAALATRWGTEASPGFHAIGLFRSNTRTECGFDDHDSALAHELLQEGVGVFLLIKPSAGGASRATVGILQDGALKSIGEFPFQLAALNDVTYPVSRRAVNAVAMERRAALRRPVAAERPEQQAKPERRPIRVLPRSITTPSRRRSLPKWAWIPLAAGVMIFAAAVWKTHTSPSAVREPPMLSAGTRAAVVSPPGVDLRVEHAGPELKVTWNHSAEAIQKSNFGTLEIEDGQVTEIRMDRAELLTGSINYTPKSGDVKVQLKLSAPSGSAAEWVRSLDPGFQPAVSTSASARAHRPSSRSKPVRKPPSVETASASPPPQLPAAAQPIEQSTVATADPAPQAPAAPAHASEPVHVAPASAPSTATASFEPVGPSRVHKVLGHVSPTHLVPGHENGGFVPAKVVREAPPKTPPQLLQGVRGVVSVDVRVAIDKHGQVTSVKLESPARKGPLPDAAMAAARNWVFKPAQKGSTPVASQAVLHFRFQNPDVVQADR